MKTAPGIRVRHKKRGTTYTMVGYAELQMSVQRTLYEGDKLAIYRADSDDSLWARHSDEFIDGRFELVEDRVGAALDAWFGSADWRARGAGTRDSYQRSMARALAAAESSASVPQEVLQALNEYDRANEAEGGSWQAYELTRDRLHHVMTDWLRSISGEKS